MESQRLEYLRLTRIIDTPLEDRYEKYTRLLSRALNCAFAAVSFVDQEREWFKSVRGAVVSEIQADRSFGKLVIESSDDIVQAQNSSLGLGHVIAFDQPPVWLVGTPILIGGVHRIGALYVGLDHDLAAREDQEVLIDMARSIKRDLAQTRYHHISQDPIREAILC